MDVKIPDSTAETFLMLTQIYRVSSVGRKWGCSSCQCRYIPCSSDSALAGKHQDIPHLWPEVMAEQSSWIPPCPRVSEEAFPEPGASPGVAQQLCSQVLLLPLPAVL